MGIIVFLIIMGNTGFISSTVWSLWVVLRVSANRQDWSSWAEGLRLIGFRV